MAGFVKLHDLWFKQPLLVNVNEIKMIKRDKCTTKLVMKDMDCYVKESVEEIEKLLIE